MTKFTQFSTSLAAMFLSFLPAAPAQALNNVSFVASFGSGSACTRAAPCAYFGVALGQTVVGGEIKCLDSGPFADGTIINKSVTIDCRETGAYVFPPVGNLAFQISAPVGQPVPFVRFRGVTMNGAAGGYQGIHLGNGIALHIENCRISGFSAAAGTGISIVPHPGVAAKVFLSDSVISGNGLQASGGGIVVKPSGTGSAYVVLNRVQMENNTFGIVADGTGSTSAIHMTIADSVVGGNTQGGIMADSPVGGAKINVMVKNTKTAYNLIGIRSSGPNATVRVDNSVVTGNFTGVNFNAGGVLLSFKNNNVEANVANGAFSGIIALK